MKLTNLLLIFLLSISTCFSQENDSTLIELKKFNEKPLSSQEKIKSILDLGKYYLNSDLTLSEKYLKEAETKIKKGDIKNNSLLNLYQAALNRKKGNYSKAKEYGLRSKLLFEKNNDTLGLVRCLISLGITDRFRNENEESVKYFNKAIELSRLKKDTLLMGSAFNMKGIAYRRLKKLDSAMLSYKKAMTLLIDVDSEDDIVSVKNNMAVVYSKQGVYEKSLPLLLENLEHNKRVNNTMSIAIGYYNVAMDYNRLKEYEQSIKYIDSSFDLSQKLGYQFRVAKAAESKGNVRAKQGDYKSALKYNKIFHSISDSIFNIESEKKLKEFELNREFDLERREMEIKTEAEKHKAKLYIILFLSLLILGAFITYLVVRNYKGKIKYVATKLEKEKLKKELLNEKVKVSEAELKWLIADNSMRLSYLKEFSIQLKNDQQESEIITTKSYIKSLLIRLQQQISTEEKLSSIQNKIEDINRGFEAKMIKDYPTLTKAEREVCVLSRVNLSIKEMASIRNTTIDSIKSIRYRLRKKLNIPKEIELESFIQSL